MTQFSPPAIELDSQWISKEEVASGVEPTVRKVALFISGCVTLDSWLPGPPEFLTVEELLDQFEPIGT